MTEETWYGQEAEDALAEEFCVWFKPMRDKNSDAEWGRILGVRRGSLVTVVEDGKWGRGHNQIRKMWMEERAHFLSMSYEEVQAEYDAKKREAKAQAEAGGAESEEEVHEDEDEAPYAIATDESLPPVSGVSDEATDVGATLLAGKPREIEQGVKPDASQPDAELPDVAKPSIVPAATPGSAALTPVAETPGDASAASDDADAADWGENAAVSVTEGASDGEGATGRATEDVQLSLTGGPPPAGLDFEDMIVLIDARDAERYVQEAFSIELDCRVSDTTVRRFPSGAVRPKGDDKA